MIPIFNYETVDEQNESVGGELSAKAQKQNEGELELVVGRMCIPAHSTLCVG
jgi:hypothetical protein